MLQLQSKHSRLEHVRASETKLDQTFDQALLRFQWHPQCSIHGIHLYFFPKEEHVCYLYMRTEYIQCFMRLFILMPSNSNMHILYIFDTSACVCKLFFITHGNVNAPNSH